MDKPTKLSETVDLMLSDNWEDRLLAELYQLDIRIKGLDEFTRCGEYARLKMPDRAVMKLQLVAMTDYYNLLLRRAVYHKLVDETDDLGFLEVGVSHE